MPHVHNETFQNLQGLSGLDKISAWEHKVEFWARRSKLDAHVLDIIEGKQATKFLKENKLANCSPFRS